MKQDEKSLLEIADLLPDGGYDEDTVREAAKNILIAIGEDPERDGLKRTPDRIARMYVELLAGYRMDPVAMINEACFEVVYDEMVVVRDIEFYSLCEHHLLPFMGRVHVAYIPNGRCLGFQRSRAS